MNRLNYRWPIATSLLVWSLSAGCSSGFQLSRFRSDVYRPEALTRFALMPLLLTTTRDQTSALTWTPPFLVQGQRRSTLSAAQYLPVAKKIEEGLAPVFAGKVVVTPAQVTDALASIQVHELTEAVQVAANGTHSHAVLVVEVSDFATRSAGASDPQASGRTDVHCYDVNGQLLWSLTAQAAQSPDDGNTPPSLIQYVEYVMDRLAPEVEQMLE